MKKRMFQILDEMNQNDTNNGTATVSLCPDFVEAKIVKAGGHVTMGVPKEAVMQLINGKQVAVLLLIDKKEFDRIKITPSIK